MALNHLIARYAPLARIPGGARKAEAGYRIVHVKIQRSPRGRLRLRWLLVSAGLVAAAFAAAVYWQEAQRIPAEPAEPASASVSRAPEPDPGPAPEKAPYSVGLPPPPDSSMSVGASRDYSVPYQVEESAPADDGYFDDALFVGDSLTTGIALYGVMDNAQVVASVGLNPDTILTKPIIRDGEGALRTVLETTAGLDPGKIYLQLGVNGISWITREHFSARYEELIDAVRAQHPDALLYAQSILPVTRKKSLGENGLYANEKIDAYNTALMELCERKKVAYVNVAEAFKENDGALAPGASPDGIHFGPAYYKRWMDYLKTHTARLPD